MQEIDINGLLQKYKEGSINKEEQALLENWYLQWSPEGPDLPMEVVQSVKKDVWNALPLPGETHKTKHRLWPSLAAAALILVFLSVGSYFLFHQPVTQQVVGNHNIVPGSNKAMLTLVDGRTINLNDAKNGKLTNQGNVVINKSSSGQIVYSSSKDHAPSQNSGFNTAATPRGGQYQLILADGTKVWLNAASSIRFPVAFTGNERKVMLKGEAYFEVAHDKAKPFKVVTNGQEVEVVGTHFNINAYDDENAVKTTLIEGSVKVLVAGKNSMLKPGEQSQTKNSEIFISPVDVNEVIAWKNGFFQFKDDHIRDVMRQLSRWYDVDIKYEGNLPDRTFSGGISRNVDAAQVLDILSFENIHFRIEGKTIVVMP